MNLKGFLLLVLILVGGLLLSGCGGNGEYESPFDLSVSSETPWEHAFLTEGRNIKLANVVTTQTLEFVAFDMVEGTLTTVTANGDRIIDTLDKGEWLRNWSTVSEFVKAKIGNPEKTGVQEPHVIITWHPDAWARVDLPN